MSSPYHSFSCQASGVTLGTTLGLIISLGFFAAEVEAKAPKLGSDRTCPKEFSQLTQPLSQDLRDYLTRTYTRNRIKRQAIAVSFPELEPLPIADQNSESQNQVNQLFLTVRSRIPGQLATTDTAYWLFLANTDRGWRLAMAFSRVGNGSPQDVSDGAIADAVKTWLRDNCLAISPTNS